MNLRAPISGIVTGFRIRKGSTKDSTDYGILDVLQPGDRDYESALVHIYVQDIEFIEFLLREYSKGQLRYINTYCIQVLVGREVVWLLRKIFGLSDQQIPVLEAGEE